MASTMEAKIQELINQVRSLQTELAAIYGDEPYGYSGEQNPMWWLERGIENFEDAIWRAKGVDQHHRVVTGDGFTRDDLLALASWHEVIETAHGNDGSPDLSDDFLRAEILREINN